MDKAMKVTSKVYKQSKDAEQESKEYSIPNTKDEEMFTSLSEKVGICIVCIDLGSTSFLQSSPGLASCLKVTSKVYKQSKDAEQESKEYSIPNTKDEEKEKPLIHLTMEHIRQTFAQCQREGRPALVTYVTAGFPRVEVGPSAMGSVKGKPSSIMSVQSLDKCSQLLRK
jgi:hypothetical protein